MTPYELQIGDLVKVADMTVKVTALSENTINGQPATMFHPIPLTIEILEASGFKYNAQASTDTRNFYDFPKRNHKGFGVERYVNGNSFIITDHQLMPFEYVHEFQHALRQCELKICANNLVIK